MKMLSLGGTCCIAHVLIFGSASGAPSYRTACLPQRALIRLNEATNILQVQDIPVHSQPKHALPLGGMVSAIRYVVVQISPSFRST